MAAPKGNKFYLLAANPGAPRKVVAPEDLWAHAVDYFEWCDNNPWEEQDWVGREGKAVKKKHPVPYTLVGLATFIGIAERTLRNYGNGSDPAYKDFLPVYTHIEQIVRTQKFTGAAAGFFNANIIARDLGMVEKVDSEQRVSGTVKFIFNEAPGNAPITDTQHNAPDGDNRETN